MTSKNATSTRPQTAMLKNPLLETKQKYLKEVDEDTDLLYLIMKSSPTKYNVDLVNEKFKKLNDFFKKKQFEERNTNLTKTEATFYRYNVLYGSKCGQLLRSYSPKMRPESVATNKSKSNRVIGDEDERCFNENEVKMLFIAKCDDLHIKSKEQLEKKFSDYCDQKCIRREVDFTEVIL